MSSSFSGVITGLFTLTSVMLTINQLILSRVIGSPNELEEQTEGTVSFRRRVERAAGVSTSPHRAGCAFILLIADALCEHAERLREPAADADADERASQECTAYTDTIETQSEALADTLDRDDIDTFDVLKATAYTHFAEDIRTGHRLATEYETALSESTAPILDETVDLLECVTIARQYVKTLYIQQDLARLSRHVLYTGISGLAAIVLTALLYARNGGPPIGPDALGVVRAALALAFAPLAMLFSHTVQFAMIAVMTESAGPFTPKEELQGS